ncbi:RusA family crossover junction endodeoxyribonuclease [Nocardia brasiliensis]|uniref:RusA family crossover junction endodeoxyribonuclease n=1 Tax=Nocardia brasiliensis TaxID=37326 RepID=UPI002458F389|nr:RusA family crossover junction endodeoxyribonuclease [Nocardia brasiliensis]
MAEIYHLPDRVLSLLDTVAEATRLETDRPLFVPGSPAPQGSKRHVGRGILIESSKAVGPWRERIALAAHRHGWPLRAGAVAITLEFVMPRPKSTPKTYTPPAIKRPDADKLERAVLDALTGIAFVDDSQVTTCYRRKRLAEIGETPGVRISIADDTEEA